jgi:mannose-6-phosphate isomerase class I
MKPQKIRWSKVYESTEEELVDFLESRSIQAERKTAEAFDQFDQQTPSQGIMTIWCAEGSFSLQCNATKTSMQPGDAVRLPIDSTFTIASGMSGCVYYQSLSD